MNTSDFTPYQYSVIRYVHDGTTNEFLNIGISLFAPKIGYFKTDITTKFQRITEAFYNADGYKYRSHVNKLIINFKSLSALVEKDEQDLFSSKPDDIEFLLRHFLRKDSSIRYSLPASGIAPKDSLDKTFDKLFFDYVEKYIPPMTVTSRDEDAVWKDVYKPVIEKVESRILEKLTPIEIVTQVDNLHFDHAWKNAKWHLYQPINFDMIRPGSIIEKAQRNLGRNVILNTNPDVGSLYLLVGEPKDKDEEVQRSFEKGLKTIQMNQYNYKLTIVRENEAIDFARSIWSDMAH